MCFNSLLEGIKIMSVHIFSQIPEVNQTAKLNSPDRSALTYKSDPNRIPLVLIKLSG